jgi:hypothetical protein
MFKVVRTWPKRLISASSITYILIAGFLFGVFFWRLSSLTPGISAAELAEKSTSSSLSGIYHNPINAPHRLLEFVFIKLLPNGSLSLRLASAVIAVAIAFCFYKLSVSWFGRVIGLFGSLVFISLPLFIIAARQATPEIMYFSPVIVIWLFAWLIKSQKTKNLTWLSLLTVCGLLLYTPGLVWWLAGALIVCQKRLIVAIAKVPSWLSAVGGLLLLAIISPLIIYGASHLGIFRRLLLIPAAWAAPLTIAKQLGWMILALVAKTPHNNPLILGRVGLISVLSLALIVFGVYAMQIAARTKAAWIGLTIVFGILAAGINNDPALLALSLPGLAIFANAGLRYLYIEWRGIFPRNPVPKGFALVLIAAVVVSQMYFGIRYALVAWPHAKPTRQLYMLK